MSILHTFGEAAIAECGFNMSLAVLTNMSFAAIKKL